MANKMVTEMTNSSETNDLIASAILECEYSFQEIARMYNTTIDHVMMVNQEIIENEQFDYDDSMDGDAQSALASVGWGCDEDYVCDMEY